MVAPVIVRNFAAVTISTGYSTFFLNRQRLLDAIELIRLLCESTQYDEQSAVDHMMDLYPLLSERQAGNYVYAALACLKYELNP